MFSFVSSVYRSNVDSVVKTEEDCISETVKKEPFVKVNFSSLLL